MRELTFMAFVCIAMMFIVYRTTSYQYEQTEIDAKRHPFDSTENSRTLELDSLPQGIVQARSDLELKQLWSRSTQKVNAQSSVLSSSSNVQEPKTDSLPCSIGAVSYENNLQSAFEVC